MPGNVYSRDITKETDLAVGRGWSLPTLNLHIRNKMTSCTQKYCNSSWKLLGVTSHLFKFKDCWFPDRASWISLGVQLMTWIPETVPLPSSCWLQTSLLRGCQESSGQSTLVTLPRQQRLLSKPGIWVTAAQPLPLCPAWHLVLMKGGRSIHRVLNLSMHDKDSCWV